MQKLIIILVLTGIGIVACAGEKQNTQSKQTAETVSEHKSVAVDHVQSNEPQTTALRAEPTATPKPKKTPFKSLSPAEMDQQIQHQNESTVTDTQDSNVSETPVLPGDGQDADVYYGLGGGN